jgi:hypothetical protein
MVRKNRGVVFCHMGVLVVMVFGAALLFLSGCKKGQGREASSPPTVEVVEVIKKDVPVYSEWIASTDGFVNATIRAQIQGYLLKQDYKSKRDRPSSRSTRDPSKQYWSRPKGNSHKSKQGGKPPRLTWSESSLWQSRRP